MMAGQDHLFEARGIRSCTSVDKITMINAGGTGLKVIRKCYRESDPHCEMVHRPFYYDDPETNHQKQCLWYLCVDIVSFDGDLNPQDRGGQYMWRVCSLHFENDFANKRKRDRRQLLADFFMMMLRDKVDIVSGDFNQGAHVLGEVVKHCCQFYQLNHDVKVDWRMPEPHKEIRTVIFNWPACPNATLKGDPIPMQLYCKRKPFWNHCHPRRLWPQALRH